MQLQEAFSIAWDLVDYLRPNCEPDKITIAGSVRRESPYVDDIELVLLPLSLQQFDLFNQPTNIIRLPAFAAAVNNIGDKIRGNASTGRHCRYKVNNTSIEVDIFMPMPHDYYRILAIRTGDRDYSKKYIAGAWRRKGWVGTEDGLRIEKECTGTLGKNGTMLWECNKENPTLPPAWKSEREFFDWLGVPFKLPKYRIG